MIPHAEINEARRLVDFDQFVNNYSTAQLGTNRDARFNSASNTG